MKALILGDVSTKFNYDDFKNKETEKLFGDFAPVMQGSEFTFVNSIKLIGNRAFYNCTSQ